MLRKKINNIIINYILANLQLIKVTPGVLRYNYMCHKNSVHDAINNKEEKIAMVFHLNKNCTNPIIHFVNINKDGIYVDNTLGNWCEMFNYYLIRYIEEDQFKEVDDIFEAYRKELKRKLPFYLKWMDLKM